MKKLIYESPAAESVRYSLQGMLCQSDYAAKFHDTDSGTGDVTFTWDDDGEFE